MLAGIDELVVESMGEETGAQGRDDCIVDRLEARPPWSSYQQLVSVL